jgi:hypothetical protein
MCYGIEDISWIFITSTITLTSPSSLHLVFISNSRTQAVGSMSEGVWVGKKLEPLRELNSQSTRCSVPASPAGYSEQLFEEHHFAGEQKLTRRRATRRQEEEEEEVRSASRVLDAGESEQPQGLLATSSCEKR